MDDATSKDGRHFVLNESSQADEENRSLDPADDSKGRTRGGWIPVGTAAERRVAHAERSTEKGRQTRRRIVDAARRVFEERGYLDVGVDEIVQEAGMARGSFYTYFSTKVDILRVISEEVAQSIDLALVTRPTDTRLDPVDSLVRSNLRYMEAYRNNAKMYALLEQLSHIDSELLEKQGQRHQRDVERIAATIERWQRRGYSDPYVAPIPTAAALLAMTRHTCFWLYVRGDKQYDEADAALAMNNAWIRTVDLRRVPNPDWSH
ncbi:MAG: TetR/AcrR family transcriptional regulator [Acidimicrobiia bacterium]